MTHFLAVGLGGFFGSGFRYLLSTWVNHRWGHNMHSLGTLSVNLIGCLAIGIFVGIFESKTHLQPELKLMLVTGLLGGFTTFSTFGLESYQFFKAGEYGFLALNLGLNFILGILFIGFGLWLSELILS